MTTYENLCVTCGQVTNVHLKRLTIGKNDQCMEKQLKKSAYWFDKHVVAQTTSRNVHRVTNDQYLQPLEIYAMITSN